LGLVELIRRQTKWVIVEERKGGIELFNTCHNKTVIKETITDEITNP